MFFPLFPQIPPLKSEMCHLFLDPAGPHAGPMPRPRPPSDDHRHRRGQRGAVLRHHHRDQDAHPGGADGRHAIGHQPKPVGCTGHGTGTGDVFLCFFGVKMVGFNESWMKMIENADWTPQLASILISLSIIIRSLWGSRILRTLRNLHIYNIFILRITWEFSNTVPF